MLEEIQCNCLGKFDVEDSLEEIDCPHCGRWILFGEIKIGDEIIKTMCMDC